MSIYVMNLVWKNSNYEGNTLITLLALADWSNDEGVSWPGIAALAKKSRQSERNCQRVLAKMEADGVLSVELRPLASSVFTINMEHLSKGDKLSPPKGDKRDKTGVTTAPKKAAQMSPNTSIEEDTSVVDTSKPSSPSKEGSTGDPRHHEVEQALIEIFLKRNPNGKAVAWSGKCAGVLGRKLKELPRASAKFFITCAKNRDASEGTNHSETPDMFIPTLQKYSGGPLNAYGKPLARAAAAGDIPEIGKKG